ncbi:MAG: tRNA epoxyqueuosine(34) reductase QueG [Fibrobacterales bacterium]
MEQLFELIDNYFEEIPEVLHWGTATPEPSTHSEALQTWLSQGKNGEMQFMENHIELRTDPKQFFPEAQSAIIFLHRYPDSIIKGTQDVEAHISAYARGTDYHTIMKSLIFKLGDQLKEIDATISMKAFVDSAPVNERELAVRAGLGWLGKHSNLIHPKSGSQFFIGGFFINKEVTKDVRTYPDGCAACRKCIDACPTQAIEDNRSIDARRCISYLTIEKKGDIDPELASKMGTNIFGCDICLEVCPWNKKHLGDTPLSQDSKFVNTFEEWDKILAHGGGFKRLFKDTPLYRAGKPKMARNIAIARQNLLNKQGK